MTLVITGQSIKTPYSSHSEQLHWVMQQAMNIITPSTSSHPTISFSSHSSLPPTSSFSFPSHPSPFFPTHPSPKLLPSPSHLFSFPLPISFPLLPTHPSPISSPLLLIHPSPFLLTHPSPISFPLLLISSCPPFSLTYLIGIIYEKRMTYRIR